jgi:DNA helicase IV
MIPKSTELVEEQAYFDVAQKHRERMKADAGEAPRAAANRGAAGWLRVWAKNRKQAIAEPDKPVAHGRIDDQAGETLYIGLETIFDDGHEVLVVNWQAPAAVPYYTASPADPLGLVRKRTFECDGNLIKDFTDLHFAKIAEALEALDSTGRPPTIPDDDATAELPMDSAHLRVDAQLLAELDRVRTGAMREIVATIQAAQFELIRAPIDQVLVIEGGPGTGKTAVALHRVSWLLFNHRDRLSPADVLVVGPHPAFTRYIQTVLPNLGDGDVEQRDIGQLGPAVHRGRSEPADVQRLKGEARMARLLARALDARIGTPEPAERLLIDGRFITLSTADVSAVLTACRQAAVPYAQRRQLLRERLLQLVRDRGSSAERDRVGPVDNLVERLWPQLSSAAFLRDLFGSRSRLAVAAGHDFTAAEATQLHRRGADRLSNEIWSAADLPLLDEAEELIHGLPRRYAHIVIDEAQDLSPMQLRSVARRSSTGSCTVVGDLTQSTGAWARDRWDEVTAHLPSTLPHTVVALRYGYRVPRQVYELAARLLPIAAPGMRPAQVVRDGPAEPIIHQVAVHERAGRAAAVAIAHAEAGRFVGVVCPPARRAEVEEALAANAVTWSSADRGELDSSINLVSPQEAKGLEFDAVVVVEPAEIVAGDERGHRLLYVALTRTTRYLDIVCVGDPLPLTVPVRPPAEPRPRVPLPPETVESADLDLLAADLAARVIGGAPAAHWEEVLHRAAEILVGHDEPEAPSGRHRRG